MKSILAIALLSLAATTPLVGPPAGGYAVSVTIRPESSANPYELLSPPRVYRSPHTCSVEVTDLANKMTIVGPKLVLMPGDHATTRTKTISGYEVVLTASISGDAQRASWEVVLRRDGQLVTTQKSDTWLRVTRVR